MASWLSFFFGLPDVPKRAPTDRPKPRILPIRDNGLNPKLPDTPKLTPLKNWSHPFKDSRDPLQQLTHMAKAAAGYYPLGRNGMFHGGVHFDGGTAGTLDQSSVHCLADGEVVAYRVDSRSPTTRYFVEGITVDVPFSRNFVLVRHHMQAPHITGSPDVPPSLTFYSLYLHLQDWAVYQDNRAHARPPFWPQSPIRRVKQTANDGRPGHPEETGLNVRNADYQGKVIELLPRGTEVVVSGKGYYRKLENRLGPSALLDADGALLGYIAASLLRPEADGEYRIVSSRERVNVRAEPDISSEVLLELPTGSVLRVSGEGDFRKLERVNQYLYFAELESEPAPQAVDQIVVLEQPVPIKAGALIGHIGDYQDGYVERPEQRLHLEVFSGDDIDLYFEASRAWAQRLPAKEKTWLKLVKGTAVVPHRDDVTGPLLRIWSETSPLSDADLLIPRSLLDSLPAEKKFHVPGRDGRNDRRWYRLDGLLHDAEQNLLNGWVCEEVGVTPTVSPWAWEGYDVLFDYSTPRHNTASFFSVIGEFTEAQCQRFKPLADNDNAGPMKQRLYDIIDRNRDGHITGDELQAALQLPAHAQAISQMVLRKESEWFYTREKWDGVDELMGHCGSTPELNWVAEKQRIEQLGWWSEVAERVGLPSWGRPYHFHPIGLVGAFSTLNDDNDLRWLNVPFGQLTFDVEGNDHEDSSHTGHRFFSRKIHWPGGASGVTIGRGYDLGQRPSPQEDLQSAGITEPLLSWLVGAKGLKGQAAMIYYESANNEIKSAVISRKQQYDLFIPIYEFMKSEVLRISRKVDVERKYGNVDWEVLDEKIQDVVVDLIYRGDYAGSTREIIQSYIADNDLAGFSSVICEQKNWLSVPADRFSRRSRYVRGLR